MIPVPKRLCERELMPISSSLIASSRFPSLTYKYVSDVRHFVFYNRVLLDQAVHLGFQPYAACCVGQSDFFERRKAALVAVDLIHKLLVLLGKHGLVELAADNMTREPRSSCERSGDQCQVAPVDRDFAVVDTHRFVATVKSSSCLPLSSP